MKMKEGIMNVFFYQTDLGKIGIAEDGTSITNLYFNKEIVSEDAIIHESELLKQAGKQLQEYLHGERTRFDLSLAPLGTAFMQRVWGALQEIHYGETRSYQEIAQKIGNPRASRAVGRANNRNPIPIIIPCHRVIGKNGILTGYAGGLATKQFLLDLEQRHENL